MHTKGLLICTHLKKGILKSTKEYEELNFKLLLRPFSLNRSFVCENADLIVFHYR